MVGQLFIAITSDIMQLHVSRHSAATKEQFDQYRELSTVT